MIHSCQILPDDITEKDGYIVQNKSYDKPATRGNGYVRINDNAIHRLLIPNREGRLRVIPIFWKESDIWTFIQCSFSYLRVFDIDFQSIEWAELFRNKFWEWRVVVLGKLAHFDEKIMLLVEDVQWSRRERTEGWNRRISKK